MDERNTTAPANRHRLDERHPSEQGGPFTNRNASPLMASIDGPRADTKRAQAECGVGVGERVTRVDYLGFGEALVLLRGGAMVARRGWNGKGMFIQIQYPNPGSKMTLPYIFMRTVDGDLVPWLASQTDLLSSDWCLVREVPALVYGHGGE